eukprot:5834890-Alexandrium_andersonii.AAC.2
MPLPRPTMPAPSVRRPPTGHEPPLLRPAPDGSKHDFPTTNLLGTSLGRGNQQGHQETHKALDQRDAPKRQ